MGTRRVTPQMHNGEQVGDAGELPEGFARLVRDALTHLYDPAYLQTHALASAPGAASHPGEAPSMGAATGPPPIEAGRALRRRLLRAIASLRPEGKAVDISGFGRIHRLLELRYVEALEPSAVMVHLGLEKSQYYREHARALDAVVSLLAQEWAPALAVPSPGVTALAPAGAAPLGPEAGYTVAPGAGPVPAPLTRFVGRARQLAEVQGLLAAERLVTLVGPPGVGKTRLALQTAAEIRDGGTFPDGIVFVPLAPLRDPALVLASVAQALRMRGTIHLPLREAVPAWLGERRLLLVLDNFEQVAAAAHDLAALVRRCPGLALLITSRVALRLRAEQQYPVPPLELPAPPGRLGDDGAAPAEAVTLFFDRARAVRPGLVLTAADTMAAGELCRRLDGLPLAIELAAARSKLLTPAELLARLERRLALLSSPAPDLPARHHSLRDAIAWSYDLLAPEEQTLFRRLGVFADGWTLAAAVAVAAPIAGAADTNPDTGAATWGEVEVLDRMATLADHSLIDRAGRDTPGWPRAGDEAGAVGTGVTAGDDGLRFGMLETLREYSVERLEASDEAETMRRRHAAFFVALAEHGEPQLRGPRAPAWLDRFERELDNVRAALNWCVARGEAGLGLRLFGKLSAYWCLRGDPEEARRWLDALLALPAAGNAPGLVRALNVGALIASRQSDFGAGGTYAGRALAEARARGDTKGAAFARVGVLGLAGPKASGTPGDLDQAQDAVAALAEARATGDPWLAAFAAFCIGFGASRNGRDATAAPLLEAALAGFRATGDTWGVAEAALELGQVALRTGEPARAASVFTEGLDAHRALGHRQSVARCLAGAAGAAVARGDPLRAARLLGAADALSEGTSAWLPGIYGAEFEQHAAAARDRLSPAAFAAAWDEGRCLPVEVAAGEAA
jgi:predicted ATPase